MFKKIVIGTLATGIMLSGAGGVFAESPTVTSVKVGTIDSKKSFVKKLEKQDFPGYKSKEEVPATKVWNGVTWYLKGATEVSKNSWTGHYE
ncbi:LCI fold-containing protein [Bacillus sp. NPDC094077]|uniref:LCI fold-containing protein n=1 Tax=Bacillus sp. NPDC094077 TaxID=3390932 RepID=UPI003D05A355